MKISKERLTQLVQEELAISLGGAGDVGPMIGGEQPHIESDGEGYMAKQNLWKIAEYASSLYELMEDTDDLEPWVEEKIAVAAFIMDSIGHYIEYAKHREHEAGEGDMDTLEPMEEPEGVGEEESEEEYEFEPSEEEYEDDGEEEIEDDEDGEDL